MSVFGNKDVSFILFILSRHCCVYLIVCTSRQKGNTMMDALWMYMVHTVKKCMRFLPVANTRFLTVFPNKSKCVSISLSHAFQK